MLCYKCNHPWNYKGKNIEEEDYITCPGCYRKIRFGKALIEDFSEQKLLTSLPEKRVKTTSFPLKLPTTSFERVSFPDGFDCLVHKNITEQIQEAPEEYDEDQDVIETIIETEEQETSEQEWEDIPTETTNAYGKKIIIKKGRRIVDEVSIKLLSPELPSHIQKAFYEKEQEQNNPFLNLPKEEPNFEINIVPGKTPLEILEHHRSFALR